MGRLFTPAECRRSEALNLKGRIVVYETLMLKELLSVLIHISYFTSMFINSVYLLYVAYLDIFLLLVALTLPLTKVLCSRRSFNCTKAGDKV